MAHCKNGHEFTKKSSYGNQGRRRCLICANEQQQFKRSIEKEKRKPRERDYVVPSKSDLNWAAGIFEGEGTATISGRRGKEAYTREIISVANTDFEIVQFFYHIWKGFFKEQSKKIDYHKTVYIWVISSYRAEFFANDILPFIRTERVRRKLNLILESRSIKRPGKRSQEYLDRAFEIRNRMKILNHRGKPIL